LTDRSVLGAVVRALVGERAGAQWSRAGGSALNDTRRLRIDGASYFVKLGPAPALAMYEAEAAALRALAHAEAVRVPAPIATGMAGAVAWLALEWLDLAPGAPDAPLGHALAALHRATAPRFGWHRDNAIGTTPQANGWEDDWATFFRDRRIAPQVALAARNGHREVAHEGERLLSRIPALLAGHSPPPSLLHGDLWSGNAARLASGEPVIFDPATYYGDRETDVAMTELFGGFPPSFHAAYREAWPLPPGYDVRRTLYNLYHVLNHLNLFGGGYRAQALQMIARLTA